MSATSRDPEEFARNTQAARMQREQAAREVGERIYGQVVELIVTGDIMGGREMVLMRIRSVAEAERRAAGLKTAEEQAEGREAVRAAVMDCAVAFGAWVAALDYKPPSSLSTGDATAA